MIQSDLPVIDPLDCLDGIKDTILYQPSAITNDWGLLGPWGKDIEIYCMELAYFSLDPNPSDMNESQESKAQHSMYLVPAPKLKLRKFRIKSPLRISCSVCAVTR